MNKLNRIMTTAFSLLLLLFLATEIHNIDNSIEQIVVHLAINLALIALILDVAHLFNKRKTLEINGNYLIISTPFRDKVFEIDKTLISTKFFKSFNGFLYIKDKNSSIVLPKYLLSKRDEEMLMWLMC